MSLFFKHLLRSVKKRPTQPIVLILTLVLSTMVSIFSLSMNSMMTDEMSMATADKYGRADFTISLSAESDSRFMIPSQVGRIIGEGDALGCLELCAFYGPERDTLMLCATELDLVSDFFDFRFTGLSPITEATRGESAFITSAFAEKNSLALGDSFTVTVGEGEKTYTVCGINDRRFMASYDLMVDISGVMRILASSSPVLSAIGDSFRPAGIIYVDVDDRRVDECISAILSDDGFSDKSVTRTADNLSDESNASNVTIPMNLSAMLSALMCAAVSFTCFYILSKERTEENYAFSAAGARPSLLILMQYAEIFLYWLIGGSLGLLLSIPLVSLADDIAGFEYAEGILTPSNTLIAEFGILLVCFITVSLFVALGKNPGRKNSTSSCRLPLILTVACYAVLFVLAMLLPPYYSLRVYILSVAVVLPMCFIVTPRMLRRFALLMAERTGKDTRLTYALKNIYSVTILQNTSRLLSALTAVCLTLIVVLGGYFGIVKSTSSILVGDYAILNAKDSCYDKAMECDSVSSISKVYLGREQHSNKLFTIVLATDDLSSISDSLGVTELPRENSVIISRAHAEMLSLKVGDSLDMSIGGREVSLTVADIAKSGVQFILVNAEYLGLPYNTLITHSHEGVDPLLAHEELSGKTALEMTAVMPLDDLLSESTRTLRIYLRVAIMMLAVALVFMIVGILDNLAESYRFRRGEFELYHLSGMSSGDTRRMKHFELAVTFLFGIAVGIIVFLIHINITQRALYGAGNDMISGFIDLFR